MNAFKRFISTVPLWAFSLVLVVVIVNSAYLFYKYQIEYDGCSYNFENGQMIYEYVEPGSPDEKAGIISGDSILSINATPIKEWLKGYNPARAGDTIDMTILRDNHEMLFRIKISSVMTIRSGFFWTIFIVIFLLNISSLYILFKKPDDKVVKLFFIYLQLFSVTVNAATLSFPDLLAILANSTFLFSGCLIGPILIHFHLLFPRPAPVIKRFKFLPLVFYLVGFLYFIPYSVMFFLRMRNPPDYISIYGILDRISLTWMSATFFIALGIAVFQFFTVKDTLSRNQLRIVIIGSFFGFITPIALALFYNQITSYNNASLVMIPHGIGSMIMIACILIAIFRYRIWDTEIFIRKALLYLGATIIITLSYLLLIYLVDQFTPAETNLVRFLILAVSVILFLLMRDRLQHRVDHLFHRESYDSATVVSDFEEKLAGVYQLEELKIKIVQGLDEIFHFKSFVFGLKINGLVYEQAAVVGMDHQATGEEYKMTPELERMLSKSRVFSPVELEKKLPVFDDAHGELIVPLLKEEHPYGFFLCGPKKSEKTYSLQDIRVLSLIARRVIALFHTASLYQKDLDRQLMLERERTRISQDMHDDVGASLTRISILSEVAKNRGDIPGETRQSLEQISDTSRGVMEEMGQIIWALNPKNDTLQGLVFYIRRFANEYLEPTSIHCAFDLPEELPDRALSVEVRRNVYLVVRESLHNVVKHSGASRVNLRLKVEDQGFKISIKDDGKGFDPDKLEFPGNGLVNMKKRMDDIGGEFFIRSEVGKGTEIGINVKM